jgi:hypothetical protein
MLQQQLFQKEEGPFVMNLDRERRIAILVAGGHYTHTASLLS